MPGAMHRTKDVTRTNTLAGKTLVDIKRTFFGHDDIEQGDFGGQFGEEKPATDPALRTDNADLDQRLENLG